MLNGRVLKSKKTAKTKEEETKKGKKKEDIDMKEKNKTKNKQKAKQVKEDSVTKEASQNTNNLDRNNSGGVVHTIEQDNRSEQARNVSNEDMDERRNNIEQKEQTIKTTTSQ